MGKQRRIANTNITNDNTAAIDIPTTLLVDDFLLVLEFDCPVADGPSACFVGFRSDLGGVCAEVGPPTKNGGAGGGIVEDVGGNSGALLLLKGFPSFL